MRHMLEAVPFKNSQLYNRTILAWLLLTTLFIILIDLQPDRISDSCYGCGYFMVGIGVWTRSGLIPFLFKNMKLKCFLKNKERRSTYCTIYYKRQVF